MVNGAFGGMLIEIEGRLVSKARVNGTSVVLELQSGSMLGCSPVEKQFFKLKA